MSKKTKISPTNTFILDDSDLEELDELSMTAIIGEVSDSFRRPKTPTGSGQNESAPGSEDSAGGDGSDSKTDFEYDPEIVALMRELDEEP